MIFFPVMVVIVLTIVLLAVNLFALFILRMLQMLGRLGRHLAISLSLIFFRLQTPLPLLQLRNFFRGQCT